MKTFAAFGTTFLFLILSVSVPRPLAQEHENGRNGANSQPQQDENRQPTARPQSEPQRDENKQTTTTPQEDRRREPSTPEPRANRPDQERSDQEKARQPEPHPQQQERTPAQTERNESRPAEAQRGKRIPDDHFRASFGPRHTFRLRREEVINNPRPVITYSGYSFELLEPWPQEWSFDDDCYIVYVDDQYYLFNPVHPGMRIALIVVNVD